MNRWLGTPTETHADIITRLERLGEVRNRFRTAEDVTEEVVVGALLPFAIVAAAVGVPAWWGIRRRRRVAPAAPDAQSAA